MKSILTISILLPTLAFSAAAPKIELSAPQLDRKVADYFAVVNGIDGQMKIIKNNSAKCTMFSKKLNEGIQKAQDALDRNESAIRTIHTNYNTKVTELEGKFSADGTTIIQGGAAALKKGILDPIKAEVSAARSVISKQQEGLREGTRLLEQNHQTIRRLLNGKSAECQAALKAYDNSYAWNKTLPGKLADVDSAFLGQVQIAQNQVDLLTAIASR